jgi:hypothetical protein
MCDTFTKSAVSKSLQNYDYSMYYLPQPVEPSAYSDPANTISNSAPFERWPKSVARYLIFPGSPLANEVVVPRMFQSVLQSPLTTFTDLKY